jgi:hypothetical protein
MPAVEIERRRRLRAWASGVSAVRRVRIAVAFVAVLGFVTASGGPAVAVAEPANETTTTSVVPASSGTAAGLRASAVAWAKTFLTGTLKEIRSLQGPECKIPASSTLPESTTALYLRGLRAVMRQHFGRDLDKIRIRGVSLRNVTTTSGEAEVRYDLPRSKVGNDNWVEYKLHDGQWKVADCKAPIGGNSSSSSASITAAPAH